MSIYTHQRRECYGQVFDRKQIWPLQWNKTGFLPSYSCVHTTIWMYHKDAKKTDRENAWRKQLKNARAILSKFWGQHPTKQHLYGHLTPISENNRRKRNKTCRNSMQPKRPAKSDERSGYIVKISGNILLSARLDDEDNVSFDWQNLSKKTNAI